MQQGKPGNPKDRALDYWPGMPLWRLRASVHRRCVRPSGAERLGVRLRKCGSRLSIGKDDGLAGQVEAVQIEAPRNVPFEKELNVVAVFVWASGQRATMGEFDPCRA